MKWRGWSRTPLRKPQAFIVVALNVFVVVWSMCRAQDIPGNTADILSMLNLITIGGYVSTSTIEAVTKRKLEEVSGCEETGK